MRHSLLDDPLLRVRTVGENGGSDREEEVQACALPQVLALLTEGRVRAFEALQPHQQQPWFCFLVQLAAMAVARECDGEGPTEAHGWRDALLGLAEGREAAWHLVVDDVAEPAFMQPPVPEGSLDAAGYKSDIVTPDALDVLITSKSHDVKSHRITRPRPEHWLFALCTLQTMEGFLGRGNYGIVRMNGGFGNRPSVGLTAGLGWGERFGRDLYVLLDQREALLERYDPGGHALLWLDSWDGAKGSGLPLEECDPYFIEICRRIRFTQNDGVLTCWRANTKAQRVDAPDELNGRTGDPWTPIEKDDAKALTLGEAGFTYDKLQQIFLSGAYARPPALEFQECERDGAFLVARTLVRGQGKTEGLHRRVVPVSKQVSLGLSSSPSERERLGKRAGRRVALASDVQRQMLYPAIAALLSGGRENADVDWDDAASWLDAFDDAVDACFFDALWASVEQDEEEASAAWQQVLLRLATEQFDDAKGSAPIAAIHRWHARSKAQSIFEGRARSVLEKAFDDVSASSDEEVPA
jgi:CRISPR system Cascade subunit CasA